MAPGAALPDHRGLPRPGRRRGLSAPAPGAALAAAKAEARRRARAVLEALDPGEAAAASARAATALAALPECRDAEYLLVFLSMPGEMDTLPLVDAALGSGKRVAVPRIEGSGEIAFVALDGSFRAWGRDRFGIPEPPAAAPAISLARLARSQVLVAAPGLAFDRRMARLGRGKGYYDRFLRALRALRAERPRGEAGTGGSLAVCGYCLSAQIVDELPAGAGDERMDFLVSESGAIRPA